MKPPAVLITDADNTLWDTNGVFAEAQLRLLADVEAMVGGVAPDADRLGFVRRHDQAIAKQDHRGLKYPPTMLVRALWTALGGVPPSAFSESEGEAIAARFVEGLRRRPMLRKGVKQGVDRLVENGVHIWVVSEGRREVVESALADHGLDQAVSLVLIAQKTVDLYQRLARRLPNDAHSICVGDQLDRDIEPAKRAGLMTAYFPGGFRPNWTDDAMKKYADAVIEDYRELLPLLEEQIAA